MLMIANKISTPKITCKIPLTHITDMDIFFPLLNDSNNFSFVCFDFCFISSVIIIPFHVRIIFYQLIS